MTATTRIERSCRAKRRFTTEGSAQTILDRMLDGTDATSTLEVYPCPHCRGYHIGHRRHPLPEPEESPHPLD